MFLLVSGRHVGARPDGHHHGISIQSSITLGKSFLQISCIWKIALTWIIVTFFHFPDSEFYLFNGFDYSFWWCDSENQELADNIDRNSCPLTDLIGKAFTLVEVQRLLIQFGKYNFIFRKIKLHSWIFLTKYNFTQILQIHAVLTVHGYKMASFDRTFMRYLLEVMILLVKNRQHHWCGLFSVFPCVVLFWKIC